MMTIFKPPLRTCSCKIPQIKRHFGITFDTASKSFPRVLIIYLKKSVKVTDLSTEGGLFHIQSNAKCNNFFFANVPLSVH